MTSVISGSHREDILSDTREYTIKTSYINVTSVKRGSYRKEILSGTRDYTITKSYNNFLPDKQCTTNAPCVLTK